MAVIGRVLIPPLNPMPVKQLYHCQNLINARVVGYPDLQWLQVDTHGLIRAIRPLGEVPTDGLGPSSCLNMAGDWLSLGGVDLQINGALGLAFSDLALGHEENLQALVHWLWSQGIDGFLPTITTTPLTQVHQALGAIAAYLATPGGTNTLPQAKMVGVHLEGPFLNPAKRGAHPETHLQPLTLERVHQVLGPWADLVKIMTLAPELDPTGTVIPDLVSQGILVSLGHSLATAAIAQHAFRLGATLVTHAFNAMPSLHHRDPGLLGAAITSPKVRCGLIADGQHICPTMVDVLLRASDYEAGLFLVSDALAPLGLPEGTYPWDQRQISIHQGTARLEEGTLAGTTLPLLAGVQNLVRWGICPVEQAIALATIAPRLALGLGNTVADLYLGQPAYLLRWHQDKTTGELVWTRLSPNQEVP